MKYVALLALCVGCGIAEADENGDASPPISVSNNSSSLDNSGSLITDPMRDVIEDIACPNDMKLIEGDYCPRVEAVCLRWQDWDGNATKPPTDGEHGRCAEYKNPTRCLSKTLIHKRFCEDIYEYPNIKGQIPESWMTYNKTVAIASKLGKRICTKSEWSMSCAGKNNHPFPYGNGYLRDSTACNIDRHLLPFDRFKDTEKMRVYDALLVPSGSMNRCVSEYGIADLTGNLDEVLRNESGVPYKSTLAGGMSIGVRNNCFAETTAHNEDFGWWEVGTRLCKDVK